MRGFWYQLKLTARDKLSVLSFLLPIAAAVAVNLLSAAGGMGETVTVYRFAVLEEELALFSPLAQYGALEPCGSVEALLDTVNEPGDEVVGLLLRDGRPTLVISGDERADTLALASVLPDLLLGGTPDYDAIPLPRAGASDSLGPLMTGLILVTALFLGLTFNTMNIVAEKEDGVFLVSGVLPMTTREYLVQKTAIGFLGSGVITVLTALICLGSTALLPPLLPLILLAGFTASVFGLFLGELASSTMAALVYVKAMMLVFIAVPLIGYLFAPDSLSGLFYLLPSYPFFCGVMEILTAGGIPWKMDLILLAHCGGWFALYLLTRRGIRKTAP